MASEVYGNGIKRLLMGDTTWKASGGSPLYAALVNATYKAAVDPDTDTTMSDVAPNRCNDAGGELADIALTAVDPAISTPDVKCDVSVADITYTAVVAGGGDASGICAFHQVSAADASRFLLTWNEFAADVTTNGSDVKVTFHADGILKVTYT